MSRFRTLLLASLVLPAAPLAAQDAPSPVATPTATPTPAPQPTLAEPVAAPTPIPEPTPLVVEPAQKRPPPRRRATPTPMRVPTASPSPAPVPTPAASPSAAVPAIVAPLPIESAHEADRPRWPWMLGTAVVVLGGIGLLLARRRPVPEEEVAADEPVLASVPIDPGPRLALSFRPTRVGFNMLSATVEGELTVINEGDVAMEEVRLRAGLLGAHGGQDAEIAAFLAEPIGRPAVPAFALAAGEQRAVRIVVATPRDGMRTMMAAGRPMFVPILTINARLAGERQVAQAFAVGAERVDSAKLAPFWLDVPDRSYAEVAARPHGMAVER